MPYDNARTCCYNFPNFDFGGAVATTIHWIKGPPGKKGRLIDVGVVTTEATVFATTLGKVLVGDAADNDKFAALNMPTGVAVKKSIDALLDPDAIILADIPADTPLQVSLVEGTGAGLTGQGYPSVIIDWY